MEPRAIVRLAFAATGLVWAALLYQAITGYAGDPLLGAGSNAQAALLACALPHPFWIGALCHYNPRPWAVLLRWFAALELAIALCWLNPASLAAPGGQMLWELAVVASVAAGMLALTWPELARLAGRMRGRRAG